MTERHRTGAPWRNFYGRRHGKTLRDRHRQYLDTDLDALSPGLVDWEANPERQPLDLGALFGGREVWLEIGFGGGEHMVHQAALHPEVGLIGAEPFINVVAMLLGRIRESGVENIRIHPGDVFSLCQFTAPVGGKHHPLNGLLSIQEPFIPALPCPGNITSLIGGVIVHQDALEIPVIL